MDVLMRCDMISLWGPSAVYVSVVDLGRNLLHYMRDENFVPGLSG